MTDHAAAATVRTPADPARLTLEFRHSDRLLDPAGSGTQTWQVLVIADGETVGSVQATRACGGRPTICASA
ncbi:hypothetical protein PV341_29360 [Streptomyces sp. PA03-1a]|nr:hypothetical protein [Streptomyces sp. PA03-1a]